MPSDLIAHYLLPLFIVIIYIPSFTYSLATPNHKMKYKYQPNIKNYQEMKITSLHRYSVKGLAGDTLTSIELKSGEGTFEDDRRYALLYEDSREEFDEENPCWVYKVCSLNKCILLQYNTLHYVLILHIPTDSLLILGEFLMCFHGSRTACDP